MHKILVISIFWFLSFVNFANGEFLSQKEQAKIRKMEMVEEERANASSPFKAKAIERAKAREQKKLEKIKKQEKTSSRFQLGAKLREEIDVKEQKENELRLKVNQSRFKRKAENAAKDRAERKKKQQERKTRRKRN